MNYTQIKNMDSSSLSDKLAGADLPVDLLQKVQDQLTHSSSNYEMVSKYVDWITHLPWHKESTTPLDINKTKELLDKSHFGLTEIKLRVLEYLSVLILQHKNGQKINHSPILFFVGLAGTGKTSFSESVARSLNRPFVRIPFGGLANIYDIRGMSKAQNEAEAGMIIKAMRTAGVKNPVILLDELDRISPEAKSGIMGVLIELLDPEQNNHFIDRYIDYPFDLSQVFFIATANNTNEISTAVLDRLEVIQMPSYSDEEKIIIAKNFLLPNLIAENGMKDISLKIDDAVWEHIARLSGYDPGIRSVERKIETIVRKVALQDVLGKGNSYTVNEENMGQWGI